ncbi:MAG: GNAT family N-acetyltransferase [Oscillospiraceae bacterium]|jgi:ribosomal protein S18 acetylase RimI-like enzyme|nr:GNAT family N-acetyltransferase [Oscillospiraceae bacterium]
MIDIKQVDCPDEKSAITLAVMHSLPQWFSPPEDIDRKAVLHRDFPFFAAYDGGKAVGFLALKPHNEYTGDVHSIGVLEGYHRQGVGAKLLSMAEEYLRERGYRYLTVKTLDASAGYEPYERTRKFYAKQGFVPLEVFTHYWDEDNPCLFLVKGL